MNFFRNPEIKLQVLIYVLLSIALCLGALLFAGSPGFIVSFICCLVLTALSIICTYKRYRCIASFSCDITRVLENTDSIELGDYSEGELAILHNQVRKLILKLNHQAQSQKSQKLYLADSLADISHQLRTPLTSINLLVSLLSKPSMNDESRLRYARELKILLSRIDWLVSTLLKISRLDAGVVSIKRENMPLSELVFKAFQPLEISMDVRNQNIITNIEKKASFVGDSAWMCEALTNILKNCMEHTPDGGSINVTGKETPLYIQITISDTGHGISPEDLPHLFERFYKGAESSDNSFGIGLALARMIITRHNGTIKAENNKPSGALFTIRLYKGTV